jgi:hypothetical protein|tara:strand:- start:315 stop:593 length:279 start_codon:yes stop_codon:yes gene_type:complete
MGIKMIKIQDVKPGKSYACKFKTEQVLDEFGCIPGLSDTPLKGLGWYEGFGELVQRDSKTELVRILDQKSNKEFVVPFNQIWDVDEVEYVEE